jgi:hypothetical protein
MRLVREIHPEYASGCPDGVNFTSLHFTSLHNFTTSLHFTSQLHNFTTLTKKLIITVNFSFQHSLLARTQASQKKLSR